MYLTSEINNTITIEKSKFITYLKRVKNEDEYKEFLIQIRKKHYDSSHVCSGFICHNIKRSSDDGEPSGTAGAPILNVLERNNLDEICALVVRYFGGIKLGTGGLTRAYSNSVVETLKNAKFVEEYEYDKYELTISYELGNKIDHFLSSQTVLLDTRYDINITYTFCSDDSNIIEKICEYTKGIRPTNIGKQIIEKDATINL